MLPTFLSWLNPFFGFFGALLTGLLGFIGMALAL